MISTTGSIPCIAAPIPAPTIAISEIGVLRTRLGPNSSSMPCVTPIEPPIAAMSSPMMKMRSSPRIAVESASRTASRYVSSGTRALHGSLRVDPVERVLGVGIRSRLRELDRLLDLGRHLLVERLELLVGDPELRTQVLDRILRLEQPPHLVLLPVHLRIADVVAGQAVGADVQERRPAARDRVLARLACRGEDRLDVLAVDLHFPHAVRGGTPTQLLGRQRQLLRRGRRLRPTVVLE